MGLPWWCCKSKEPKTRTTDLPECSGSLIKHGPHDMSGPCCKPESCDSCQMLSASPWQILAIVSMDASSGAAVRIYNRYLRVCSSLIIPLHRITSVCLAPKRQSGVSKTTHQKKVGWRDPKFWVSKTTFKNNSPFKTATKTNNLPGPQSLHPQLTAQGIPPAAAPATAGPSASPRHRLQTAALGRGATAPGPTASSPGTNGQQKPWRKVHLGWNKGGEPVGSLRVQDVVNQHGAKYHEFSDFRMDA